MNKVIPIVLLAALFVLFLVWGILMWNNDVNGHDNLSIDLFGGTVLFLSFAIAIFTYQNNKKRDEYQIAERRREHYIIDDKLKTIRMAIGHNDVQLQTIVAIANIMDYRRPGFMPEKVMKIHEEFDSYLGYMEGIALLANQGSIMRESLEGLWSYYFKQLQSAHLLDYSNPEYPVSIDDINNCIDDLYKDNKQTGNAIKSRIIRYIPQEAAQFEESSVAKPCNQKEVINPLHRPVWYYINHGENEFKPIVDFYRKFCVDGKGKGKLKVKDK